MTEPTLISLQLNIHRVQDNSKPKCFCYIFYKTRPILVNVGCSVLNKFVTQCYKRFPPHLNSVSTLPCGT